MGSYSKEYDVTNHFIHANVNHDILYKVYKTLGNSLFQVEGYGKHNHNFYIQILECPLAFELCKLW